MIKQEKKSGIFFYVITGFVLLLLIVAILAPVLAPNDPYETNLMVAQQGPSRAYPLGTDGLGRCMLSRVLYGARISIFASIAATAIVFFVGTVIGVLCGYFGGVVDMILNKIITIMQAFPQIILAIAIAGLLGIGIVNTIIALCMVQWVGYARLARSFTFSIRQRTFIKAARVCGESHGKIIFRRVIPNIISPLIVNASLGIAAMIMEIAALSYLGVGVAEPMAEWGAMINAGRDYMQTDVKMVLIPGVAIFLTAAIFNLFGEKLRDKLR
jgi:ABC-type dipeptide/oligopeptide/nickel transport system permease subunit